MFNKVKALFGLLKTEPIADKDELLQVCADVALTQLKRDTLSLQRDADIQAINDKYSAEIESHNSAIDHEVKRIRAWAIANKAEFGKRKSFILGGHILEFRTSPAAVKTLDGKKEVDAVDFLLGLQGEENDALRERVLRVTAALDKDAIKREFRLGKDGRGETLTASGLQVTTEETFSFIPNREELQSIAETSVVEGRAA